MIRKLIGSGAFVLFILIVLALYCCLRIGAEEDRWMSEHPPRGKERDGDSSGEEDG